MTHLLVTNDFPPKVGGIQTYLFELWRRMDPSSYVVLTARSDRDAETFDAAQEREGITVVRTAQGFLLPTPSLRRQICELATRHDAGLVVLDPALPVGLVGPKLSLPYAVVLHGAEVTVPARLPLTRQALRRVLADASLVVAAGGYPAAEAASLLDGRLPPVVEVPPGVDVNQIHPLDQDARQEARRKLGLGDHQLLVSSVSRLVPRKGMDVVIEAVSRLAPSFPGLELRIAGDGRDRGRLERLIQRTGAPARLLGRISEPDKAVLLAASDVFVMACRNRWLDLEQEGFGIVFLEAAAAGVPQVAGRSGGAHEAVEDGVTGLVVEHPEDVGALAQALRQLLADPGRRTAMGEAARRRVRESFDYGVLAPRLAGALGKVGG